MRGFATRTALLATVLLTFVLVLNVGPALANHVSCGDTITQDTTLDADLTNCYEGIVIGADNITLDLAGHSIASTQFGVNNRTGHDDVTVKRGKIENGGYGISLANADRNVIEDL